MSDEIERKHPLAKCEKCPWNEIGHYAGSKGPDTADVLVVGESPGAVEAESGIPFTGPGGKLLDKVLDHHGLVSDDIRFTNVVACHPQYQPGKKTEVPKEAIAACSPRLAAETSGRRSILLLGNTAKAAVLETAQAITSVRQGPPREISRLPGTKIVATVHPAACLRSSDMFPSLVKDIGKLANQDIYIKWEAPKWKSFEFPTDAQQAMQTIAEMPDDIPLAVDIETDVEKDTSFTHPRGLLSVGLGYQPGKAVVIGEEALRSRAVLDKLQVLLDNKKVLCHNGKYDLQVLMRRGIIDAPKLYADTMLASYVLDERPGGHGLKGLSSEILGAPDYAADVKKYVGKGDSYALIPRPALYKYNAYDAALTFDLWGHFEREMNDSNLHRVHDALVRYSNTLTYIELDGVGINNDYLDSLTDEYLESLAELEEELKEWVGNPRSWQQVAAALKDLRLFASDTSADTLKGLLENAKEGTDAERFLTLMLIYRKQAKMYGTYVKGTRIRMIDGRVYPTYMIHGTVFGRLACRNPNIHNVPRGDKIKKLFVPARDGHVFVQCDYSQAELRVMACEAQDKYLQEVFSDPSRDIHNEISDVLYGVGKWTKEQRVRTKAYVFGSAYGREPYSIAQEFKVPLREAERGQKAFFSSIPDTVKWRAGIQNQVFGQGKSLQTSFGRKRRFWLITRENKSDISKESLAFVPQSTASDICMESLVRIRDFFGWETNGPKIRLTVHDSIAVECAEEDKFEVGREMSRIMQETAAEVYSDFVPFIADAEYGNSWGELEDE